MAGYNGFSMSNNAVAAYEDGLVPASKVPGVPAVLVKRFCRPVEWHHSSKFYNRVDFFNPKEVRATFGLEANEDYGVDRLAVDALAGFKSETKEAPDVLVNCHVEWIEWTGSRRHPKAKEMVADGCTVSVSGRTATITLPGGRVITKRLATSGFRFKNIG